MEITEPVILEIPQGKRHVRVELTSRADGRDLIAAITRSMDRLPDDGVHDMPPALVTEVAAAPIEQHAPHTRDGKLTPAELREQLAGMSAGSLSYLWIHVNGYCPAAVNSALRCERESRPPEPEPVSPEAAEALADPAAIPTADGEHVTCPSCGFRDGRHNPAGCKRQKRLADLAKQVARLSHPDASADREGYAPDESIADGSPLVVTDDRCECGHPARVHNFVDVGRRGFCHECDPGSCKQYQDAGDFAGTVEPSGLELHRSVRLLRRDKDLAVVESDPCPESHPSKGTPCIGGKHHGPPCRDLDGDEWVPALSAVSS